MNILFNYNFKIYRCQFACRFNSSAKVFIVSVFTVLIPTWDSHEQLLPQGPLNQASYFSLIYKGFKPQCLKQSQNCYQVKVVFLLLLYQYYNNILNTTIICCFDRSVIWSWASDESCQMSLLTALLSQFNDIVQWYFIIILMICLNSLTRESRLKLKWEALLFLIFLLLLPS
jgi:hypothetical protein